jgi:hypothetical protein
MRLRLPIFGRKRRPSAVVFGEHGSRAVTWGAEFGWLRDVSPAAWIGPRLHPFAQDIGSVIPEGFAAYARLFHPVDADRDRRERWSDVAARTGRILHSEMQFHLIAAPRSQTPSVDYNRDNQPRMGTLHLEQRRILADHLRSATSTPDRCWFAMWEGFGGLDDGEVGARVELPNRNYLLYNGAIDRALESPFPFDQSPNLWWPDDRAWFVATEIDFDSTFVGGDEGLIAALVSDDRLETLPIALSAKADAAADRINWALNARQKNGPVVDPTTGPE